jgi:putative hydrolases of HD superfamily
MMPPNNPENPVNLVNPVSSARLARQIAFLIEADKLKTIIRRTPLVDRSRAENSAEHSWHLLLAAMVLREYLPGKGQECDLLHTLQLLVVHDLVEIDAGDTFAYDAAGQTTKAAREIAAADRIFGLLPTDQTSEFRALWEEFEAQRSPEARFAHAVDRVQPLLQNASSGGGSWSTHDVTRDQVLRRMAPVESELPAVWPLVLQIIDAFCSSGTIRTNASLDGAQLVAEAAKDPVR